MHKSGSYSDPSNYRLIALLSNFSKIYERVIYCRMFSFIHKHNILSPNQFGFRPHQSTEMALISLFDTITTARDQNKFTCSVILDFQKAFDTIDIQILLCKLQHYGFRGLTLNYLSSYLSNRSQYVSLQCSRSTLAASTHGVPQGSILGPLLFLLYINDILNVMPDSQSILFADDNTATFSASSPFALQALVNNNLKLLSEWILANKLTLNISKSHIICFTNAKIKWSSPLKFLYNGSELTQVTSTTILGVSFDQNISFLPHIISLRKKLASAVYIYSNIRDIIPKYIARSLYFSLFHCHLNYCLLLWGSSCPTHLSPLNVLHHKILKSFLLLPKRTPSKEVFIKANISPISHHFTLSLCKIIYIFLHSPDSLSLSFSSLFIPTSRIHKHATRASANQDLFIISSNSEARSNSIAVLGPTAWNSIPGHLKTIPSLSVFLTQLKKYLTTKLN